MRYTALCVLLISARALCGQALSESQATAQAQGILAHMTLRQKVYELHGHGSISYGLSRVFCRWSSPIKAGGNRRLGVPVTRFYDGPRGISHNRGATAFPVTMARGASWDRLLEARVGEAMAVEIRALGGNYSGAVCMNVLRHPAWGRAQETYGEDPYLLGEMASALTAGIQKQGIQACVKHFAANSMENNRYGGNIRMSDRTLYEVYLPHFKKVIQGGAASVMSAYNRLNGEYCGENKRLLNDILRQEWGFKGYVTSDWVYGLHNAQKGIEAGENVEMPGCKVYTLRHIRQLLREGKVTVAQIDALVLPVVRTKLLFTPHDGIRYPTSVVGSSEHTALAREVAEKSAVLLKNEASLLPLDKTKIKRIAVIGALADKKQTGDNGSSSVLPRYIVTPLEGIRSYCHDRGIEVLYSPLSDSGTVSRLCAQAEVVLIVAGTTTLDEGEYNGTGTIRDRNNPDKAGFAIKAGMMSLGGDRSYLHLHAADIALIHTAAAANKNIVVSLVAGSAVTVEEWQQEVPAILETFYNGMEGGNALARLLFGEVNPSGKLPFCLPKLESDLPAFDSYADTVDYGYYHGYTLLDKEKKTPRYPFGYGLSYTSFALSDLRVYGSEVSAADTIHVSVAIQNTGHLKGAEVVQLYADFSELRMEMPVKLLRGFEKVELQPGEVQRVDFYLPASSLAYYEPGAKKWVTEKAKYSLSVGNSADVSGHLSAAIRVR